MCKQTYTSQINTYTYQYHIIYNINHLYCFMNVHNITSNLTRYE